MKCANIDKSEKSQPFHRHTIFNANTAAVGNSRTAKPSCKTLAALPVGGTTGLCHVASGRIDEAAEWYAAHRETCERPIVPALRKRFGLTPIEVVQAIRDANARRA